MIVELCPRNSNHVAGMSDIQQTIVEVFVSNDSIARQVAMINPDLSRKLDLDEIIALLRIVQLEVAKNNIGLRLDTETASSQT